MPYSDRAMADELADLIRVVVHVALLPVRHQLAGRDV